jgi:predicted hotdog family 3-hydroxylacyl-ACP dehydratase
VKPEYSVAELVPHSGRMSLLSEIVDYGDDWLLAEVVISRDSTFADARGVPAWIGLEYMAQAIAAYSGLEERLQGGKPKIGFLLGARRYECTEERFAIGQKLCVRVQPEMLGANGLNVFNCELQGDGVSASAVVNVFQPDDADAFLQEALG